MTPRLSLALSLAAALGLAGCGGAYEEAAYPEAPPPAPRAVQGDREVEVLQVPEQPPPPPSSEVAEVPVVGGDNDTAEYRDTDPAALTEFRSTLDPYGAWVDDDTYGTVWVPASHVVGPEFTPYVTAGHWAYDDGYVWVSDYSWGWAPFHYGRWVYIDGRGWAWIPGRVYRGAWVVWRTGPVGFGYVGWGPAPPLWYWRGGYAYGFAGGYRTPYYFCESRHVFHPQVGGRVVRGPLARDIGARTEPYIPAQPSIGPGRVPANPTVAGAHPAGTPVGLRRGADGPSLSSLGHEPSRVPRPVRDEPGLSRAFGLASPHTAVPMGARAPSVAPRPVGALARPQPEGAVGPRALPSAASPHYESRAPITRAEPGPTRLPPLRTEPRPYVAPAPRSAEAFRAPPLVEHHRAPEAAQAPTFHGAPVVRAPSGGAPHAAPTVRSAAPSSAPVVRSSPSYTPRASSSPSFSSPSVSVSRPSSPSYSPGPRSPSYAPRTSSPGRVRR